MKRIVANFLIGPTNCIFDGDVHIGCWTQSLFEVKNIIREQLNHQSCKEISSELKHETYREQLFVLQECLSHQFQLVSNLISLPKPIHILQLLLFQMDW